MGLRDRPMVSATAVTRPRVAVRWGQVALEAGALVFLVVSATVMFTPLLWMVVSAFKAEWEVTAIPPVWLPSQWKVENFAHVLNASPIGVGYKNSLIIATIVTIIQVFTSALAGYAFAKLRFPGRNILFIGVLSTMMLPGFLIQIPLYVLMVNIGWMNTYQAMIVPFLFTPFGIFMMRQFMLNIPSDYIDAARIDGAGEIKIIYSVIFPLIREAAAALAIFVFIAHWNELFWALLMLRQRHMFTLPLALFVIQGDYGTFYHLVLAGATLAIIPPLIVYALFQEHIVRGITLTGLKG